MLSQSGCVSRVIICYLDRIVSNSHIPLESPKVSHGHVLRVPGLRGRSKPFAKLINRRLSDQCHCHLAVANVEIAGPCAVPAQRLVRIEELLHVPAFGKILGQLLDLTPIARPEECIETVFFGPLSLPLDELVERPGV